MSRARKPTDAVQVTAWAKPLGDRLKEIRQERGLPLSAVASATGISTSFLSLLENGRTDVSLGRLLPVLDFYGLTVGEVLDAPQPIADTVLRAGEGPHLFTVSTGIDIYLATHDSGRPFLPLLGVYQPGARMHDWSQHDADEFLYILSGSVAIETRDDLLTLDEGDSMFISGRRDHRIAAKGSTESKLLVVTTEHPFGAPG